MVLESTILCLDSSDWMRNGDYVPSRLEAQQDAATLICNERTRINPENTVGIIAMGSSGVELLTSPTEDIGQLLAAVAKLEVGGKIDFCASVQVAQLALKHRKNKNGGQRIIIFVGSPLDVDSSKLLKVGKQLKKNNVSIDVINLGEYNGNSDLLSEFVKTVDSGDDSHLINIPSGVSPLDALSSSPVLSGDMYGGSGGTLGGGTTSGSGGGAFEEYGGIDPSLDPELAMAIRVSTEEARAKEEANKANAVAVPNDSTFTASDMDAEDEEVLMQRALQMSMMDSGPSVTESISPQPVKETSASSTTPASSSSSIEPVNTSTGGNYLDPAFVSQLLQSVDGDMNDPLLQAALQQLSSEGGGGGATAKKDESKEGGREDTSGDNQKKRKNEDA